MERLTENKIVLVVRQTRLDELVARFNTLEQAKFYIEHLGADFSDYLEEHRRYYANLETARFALDSVGRLQVLDRAFLPNFVFGKEDVVVAVGRDGMVANTMKYLDGHPLVGVNPDPDRWDGVLLPFRAEELADVLPEVIRGGRGTKDISMAEVRLSDGQTLLAVNDFFIGQKTHLSARYELRLGERSENQSSSGIIVSTGLGSTAWLRSVVTGAAGIVGYLTGTQFPETSETQFEWGADYLYYSVREPFPSVSSQASLVFGRFANDAPLVVTSHMPENGVIFSDGIEHDFLGFNSGVSATVTVAGRKGRLVV